MIELPDSFVRIQHDLLGDTANAWLSRLPNIVAACAMRWDLTLVRRLDPLTYNYIVRALLPDNTPVILKICSPGGEYAPQREALRLFDGHGAVRLLDSDPDNEVLLLECCEPGVMLSTLTDDDTATILAATMMRQLWRPAPSRHPFPTVADWGRGFARLHARFDGGSGPLPAALVDQAERLYRELVESIVDPVVLHGDLHHENILSAHRQPWLVIDPKGVIGEPAYETATFMRNNLPDPPSGGETARLLARRMAILCERLGLDRVRVWGWALAVTVLTAWENIEDHGRGWEEKIAIAEHIAALKPL